VIGKDTSEAFLKAGDLDAFSLLHLATHAVADESAPDRSAVLLAPSAGGDDGLLTVPEIADLRLREKVVVLAACESSVGAVRRGEGVLSLARAFFEGRATAVVGTLGLVRDADAVVLFRDFYDSIGRGSTVSRTPLLRQSGPRSAVVLRRLFGAGSFWSVTEPSLRVPLPLRPSFGPPPSLPASGSSGLPGASDASRGGGEARYRSRCRRRSWRASAGAERPAGSSPRRCRGLLFRAARVQMPGRTSPSGARSWGRVLCPVRGV